MIKILVVDDEPGICTALEQTFSVVGYNTLSATSGRKALEIVKKEHPNAVFLDILMPEMNGFELLKEIKNFDKKIIVIMVSSRSDDATKLEAFKLGAADFVSKPFHGDHLRDLVTTNILSIKKNHKDMDLPRILIVEDQEDIRISTEKLLFRNLDIHIESSEDGLDALEKIKQTTFDVILLDIKLPKMTGDELLPIIKEKNPKTKVIIVSSWLGEEVLTKTKEAGADCYLEKPLMPDVLLARTKMILLGINKCIIKN